MDDIHPVLTEMKREMALYRGQGFGIAVEGSPIVADLLTRLFFCRQEERRLGFMNVQTSV